MISYFPIIIIIRIFPTYCRSAQCLLQKENYQLVGGIPTPLKNMKVSRDDDYSQYMEK